MPPHSLNLCAQENVHVNNAGLFPDKRAENSIHFLPANGALQQFSKVKREQLIASLKERLSSPEWWDAGAVAVGAPAGHRVARHKANARDFTQMVVATRGLPAHVLVDLYVGDVLNEKDFEARLSSSGVYRGVRYRRYIQTIRHNSQTYSIDATEHQNDMAELNDYRSFLPGFVQTPTDAVPNVAFVDFIHTKGGVGRLQSAIVTLLPVARGQELMLDYSEEYWDAKRAYAEQDAEVQRQAELLARQPGFHNEMVKELRSQLAIAVAAKEQLQSQLAAAAAPAQEQLKSKLARALARKKKLKAELAAAAAANDNLKSELAASKGAQDQLRSKMTKSAAGKEQLQSQLAQVAAAKEHLQSQLATAAAANEQLQLQLSTAAAGADKLKSQLLLAAAAQEKLRSELTGAVAAQQQLQSQLGASVAAKQKLSSELQVAMAVQEKLKSGLAAATAGNVNLQRQVELLTKQQQQQAAAQQQGPCQLVQPSSSAEAATQASCVPQPQVAAPPARPPHAKQPVARPAAAPQPAAATQPAAGTQPAATAAARARAATQTALDARLLSAAARCDAAAIRSAIADGAHASCRDDHGQTPLLLAALAGGCEAVSALVQLAPGAMADRDRGGRTALTLAVEARQVGVAARMMRAVVAPELARAAGAAMKAAADGSRKRKVDDVIVIDD